MALDLSLINAAMGKPADSFVDTPTAEVGEISEASQSSGLDLSLINAAMGKKTEAPATSLPDQSAMDFIRANEGFRNKVYLDTEGFPTVGAGRKLPDEFKDKVGMEFPQEELDRMFQEDFAKAQAGADRIIAKEKLENVTPTQRQIITDMVFNMGEAGAGGFKNTFKHMREGDMQKAAEELLDSKYARQVPNRAKRNAELLRGDADELAAPAEPDFTGLIAPEADMSDVDLLDTALGTIETAGQLSYGTLTTLPAEIFRHMYFVPAAKMASALGIGPKHTDKEIAKAGEFVTGQLTTFGGLLEPDTDFGRDTLNAINTMMQPISDASHFVAGIIDPETSPNAHNALASVAELGIFATLPAGVGKGVKGIKTTANKIAGMKAGRKKVRAERNLKDRILELDKKLNDPVIIEKINKSVESFQEALTSPKGRQFADELNNIIKTGQESIRGKSRDIIATIPEEFKPKKDKPPVGEPLKTTEAGFAERLAEQKEAVARRQGIQEQLKRAKITEKEYPPGAIGPTPEGVRPPKPPAPERPPVKFKTAQELLAEKEAAINRSTGVTAKNLAKQFLSDEGGFLELDFRNWKSKFKDRLNPEEKASVQRLAKAASEAKKGLEEFLVSQGLSTTEAKQVREMYKMLEIERPNRASTRKNVVSDIGKPKELYELEPGEGVVNQHRTAKGKVAVGEKMMNAVKQVDITDTPWLVKGLTVPAHKFKELPGEVRKLWDRQRDANKLYHDEAKIHKQHIKDLFEEYPDTKLQEEAGLVALSKTKNGMDALNKMGKKVPEGPIRYQGMLDHLEVLYKDLFDRINEVRVEIGKAPLKEMDNYTPFFQRESLYDSIGKKLKKTDEGVKEVQSDFNLLLDSVEDVKYRHSGPVMDATTLRHVKRGKLRKGVTLETNPLKMYAKYSDAALKHIHTSPLNAYVKELVSTNLTDPKTGEVFNMHMQNPDLANFLGGWSNRVAGKPNLDLPKQVTRTLNKLSGNMTAAVLGAAARTMIVQPAALVMTMKEYGTRATAKGVTDMMMRKRLPAMDKSRELSVRVHDAALQNTMDTLTAKGPLKAFNWWKGKSLSGMTFMDYLAAEAHWRTSYESIKKAQPKISELEAVRHADASLVRTHGAGDPGAVSPIQGNALGKAVTLWQTFMINQANSLAKDVVGIKGFDPKSRKNMGKLLRFTAGAFVFNTVLQEGLGMSGAFPSPIKAISDGLEKGDPAAAIALNTLLEFTELAPFGGSLLYGSNPLGAMVDFAGDISEVFSKDPRAGQALPRAMAGDAKAIQTLVEIIGKLTGLGGTRQIVKTVMGVKRGEVIPGVIPRTGKVKKKRRRSGRKSRRSSRRSSRI